MQDYDFRPRVQGSFSKEEESDLRRPASQPAVTFPTLGPIRHPLYNFCAQGPLPCPALNSVRPSSPPGPTPASRTRAPAAHRQAHPGREGACPEVDAGSSPADIHSEDGCGNSPDVLPSAAKAETAWGPLPKLCHADTDEQ